MRYRICRHYTIKFVFALIFFATTSFTSHEDITNYYGIPPVINFENTEYKLATSSHPNSAYYKQEYIPANDTVSHFHNMILIDFIQTSLPISDAVQAQVGNIVNRKKTDLVCNYQLLKNKETNNYILDFVMSEGTTDFIDLVEWSAYHYQPYTDKAGHSGILLFGICHRAYSNQVMPYLNSLKEVRHNELKNLNSFPIPNIQIQ